MRRVPTTKLCLKVGALPGNNDIGTAVLDIEERHVFREGKLESNGDDNDNESHGHGYGDCG